MSSGILALSCLNLTSTDQLFLKIIKTDRVKIKPRGKIRTPAAFDLESHLSKCLDIRECVQEILQTFFLNVKKCAAPEEISLLHSFRSIHQQQPSLVFCFLFWAQAATPRLVDKCCRGHLKTR